MRTVDYATGEPLFQISTKISLSWPFTSIQLAYDHANNLDSVDARAKDFQENLTFDNNTSVTFRGGFDCNYNSNLNRYTSVNGLLTIGGPGSGTGQVVVENIILW